MISWLIFLFIVIAFTSILNRMLSSGVVACLAASIASTLAFQLIGAIQLGHLDKFSLLAVAVTFPLALLISGAEILLLRKQKGPRDRNA